MNENILAEKYAPRVIDDCILPIELKKTFKDIVSSGNMQHMLFSGSSGIGKTTVAKALANEMDYDCMMINASLENGIDVLRSKIMQFASTVSFNGKPKVVILDEGDYLNASSIQPALRGFMDEFQKNCRFIITCNYKNRIITPLQSRLVCIDFNLDKKDKPEMAKGYYKRTIEILKTENIEYDKDVVAELVSKFFPDFRSILNEIQRYGVSGKIDSGILANLSESDYAELIAAMKDKKFNDVRKWVAVHSDVPFSELSSKLYEMSDKMVPNSIPQLVLLCASYDYHSAFVTNQEINTTAFLVEVMASCQWR